MSVFPREFPVVIVGAGPTGLAAANLLAVYGVSVLVIEKSPAPMDIPRAIVLDDVGARVLQAFGADRPFMAQTVPGLGDRYYDQDGARFLEIATGQPVFGFQPTNHISQPEMESALLGVAADQPHVDLRFDCEVLGLEATADHVTLEVVHGQGRAHRINAAFVLACDGGRSTIREALGISMQGMTYRQDWVVIDTLNDPDTSGFTRFFCSSQRPHISIPAPAGGRRYEFMLRPGEGRETVLAPGFVPALLAPFRDISPNDISREVIYGYHARMARKFRAGRVFLLGDAAHLTPPFAGQGMNGGLRDAMNFAWKLAAVVNGGADTALLDSYDTERRAPAWDMIRLAVAIGDILMPGTARHGARGAHLVTLPAGFQDARDYLSKRRFHPPLGLEEGCFLGLGKEALVGEMIPQPRVASNGDMVPLDRLLGPGFALIAQDEVGQAALAGLQRTRFCGHALASVTLDPGGVGKPLAVHRRKIVLVRPDRYCAAVFAPDDLTSGLARMAGLLGCADG